MSRISFFPCISSHRLRWKNISRRFEAACTRDKNTSAPKFPRKFARANNLLVTCFKTLKLQNVCERVLNIGWVCSSHLRYQKPACRMFTSYVRLLPLDHAWRLAYCVKWQCRRGEEEKWRKEEKVRREERERLKIRLWKQPYNCVSASQISNFRFRYFP
jgi:hypothetical protein